LVREFHQLIEIARSWVEAGRIVSSLIEALLEFLPFAGGPISEFVEAVVEVPVTYFGEFTQLTDADFEEELLCNLYCSLKVQLGGRNSFNVSDMKMAVAQAARFSKTLHPKLPLVAPYGQFFAKFLGGFSEEQLMRRVFSWTVASGKCNLCEDCEEELELVVTFDPGTYYWKASKLVGDDFIGYPSGHLGPGGESGNCLTGVAKGSKWAAACEVRLPARAEVRNVAFSYNYMWHEWGTRRLWRVAQILDEQRNVLSSNNHFPNAGDRGKWDRHSSNFSPVAGARWVQVGLAHTQFSSQVFKYFKIDNIKIKYVVKVV
jgi:hypothetical protein